MNPTRTAFVLFGTSLMFILMVIRHRKYRGVPVWKMTIVCAFLAVSGVIGALLMHYIENGDFGGTSFFGAVLFVPIFMLPVSLLTKIPYGTTMDLCAPCECIMLSVLKYNCYINGCCYGRILMNANGAEYQFPSQLTEMTASVIVMIVLLFFERKQKYINKIYPLYLIIYGSLRAILNNLRGDLSAFIWILPAGHFWSLISIAMGFTVLFLIIRKEKKAVPATTK